MSDENALTPEEFETAEVEESIGAVQETLDKFLDSANVYAVYGEPVQNGDTTIIPTAEVLSVMGFGLGYGSGYGSDQEDKGGGSGGGGGGGGRVLARPVAVVVASSEGVRVEPVMDITKIALAALTAGGFMLGMILRMLNTRKSMPNFEED